MKTKKILILMIVIMVSFSQFACMQTEKTEEVNIYNGETEINVDGRSFELEDIPENMAEEVVINDFKYSIVGDFDSLSKILADTEPHNISLKNEEEQFNEGDYIQSYTIHEVATLTINEYNQQKLENGKYNPLYFYGWEEIVEKYNLKEYEIINVKFTQKHSDKSIELGPQCGDGTYNRNFIVGKSSKDNNYKIYEYGGMQILHIISTLRNKRDSSESLLNV